MMQSEDIIFNDISGHLYSSDIYIYNASQHGVDIA